MTGPAYRHELIKGILDKSGLKVFYGNDIMDGDARSFPYISYIDSETEYFYADGVPFEVTEIFDIRLYTKNKSIENEASIERLLKDNMIPFTKKDGFKDYRDEYHVTTYEVSI